MEDVVCGLIVKDRKEVESLTFVCVLNHESFGTLAPEANV
jgi:hypothetical protein